MNVLSLFDGMSCGQIALNKLGVKFDKYYACEIDKWSIKVTQKNFPNTIQLGSVTDLQDVNKILPKIDLIIGGSPCQGFSFAGKQLNFEDPRSMLFFEFVRILNEARERNSNILFMLENVKMKTEYKNVISEYLGVQPIEINSALVSAQNRKRLFWTNIKNITQPEDKGILLRDIIHENMDELIEVDQFNINPSGKGMNGLVYCIAKDKSNTLTTNKGEGQKISVGVSETPVIIEPAPETDAQIKWFKKNAEDRLKKKYSALDPEKAITMTARQYANWNGNFIMEELEKYIVPFDKTLQILNKEVERGKIGFFRKDSQANRVYYIHNKSVTLCGEAGGGAGKMGQYLFGCITPARTEKRQNGQRFNEGKKFYTLTAQDRHGILIEGYIRKLTPIECERLQTVPDHYTSGVSHSQRYKMLGNGWTVDVISHIFNFANFKKRNMNKSEIKNVMLNKSEYAFVADISAAEAKERFTIILEKDLLRNDDLIAVKDLLSFHDPIRSYDLRYDGKNQLLITVLYMAVRYRNYLNKMTCIKSLTFAGKYSVFNKIMTPEQLKHAEDVFKHKYINSFGETAYYRKVLANKKKETRSKRDKK